MAKFTDEQRRQNRIQAGLPLEHPEVPAGKVRVRVEVTLEVDAEGWNMDYGTGTEPAAIRKDVKSAVHSLLNEYNDSMTVVKSS